ncbi:MAG: hypothetical protein GY708_28130 [Actinomycetia bacterium]|nr:hypothetical protein [Actinomycetes bacterium]MCP4959419.1 hypothetical protein [Actinomycetes bacterium]
MAKIIRVVVLVILGTLIVRLLRRSDGPQSLPTMRPVGSPQSVADGARVVDAPAGPTAPAAKSPDQASPWVDSLDGSCPDSHPVKLKLSSGIYHVAGQHNYGRTNADRCYCDEQAAETDGFRASKV